MKRLIAAEKKAHLNVHPALPAVRRVRAMEGVLNIIP